MYRTSSLPKIPNNLRDKLYVGDIIGPTNGLPILCTSSETCLYTKILNINDRLFAQSEPDQENLAPINWLLTIDHEVKPKIKRGQKSTPPVKPVAGEKIRITSVGPYGARGVIIK